MISLSKRETLLLGAIAWYYRQHAERCDNISNRPMAEKQKARDLERVAVLEKVLSQNGSDALQRATSLLQALFDLQNGPPTERRTGAWVEVMGQSISFLGEMERAGVVAEEIKPIGG